MKPKHKALLYNFMAFVILFLIARLALGYYLPINPIFLAVTSAIIANVLAPKFGAIKTDKGEKVLMKWIFIKGVREI
ncbi:hypothetical protein HME9304_02613 [Flagellimonas maritima]|uniref:Uncharacterized protein n=1 Tax=Flagellimonas maritima TaxID=1383885 RepID=A0A2Z4LUT7_9FLAO|nr:hypothetical protein [Allomuricauda aurantiaca]AWX45586.1 hypothetical protein HME9304_02613 [Allomuricauda aurantiaca]